MSAKNFLIFIVVLLGAAALITGCGDSVGTGEEAPPLPPQNMMATPTATGQVVLRWDPNTQPNLVGYNVYRNDGLATVTLTEAPITETFYTDASAQTNTPYEYRVTSVSSSGVESSYASRLVELREFRKNKRDRSD